MADGGARAYISGVHHTYSRSEASRCQNIWQATNTRNGWKTKLDLSKGRKNAKRKENHIRWITFLGYPFTRERSVNTHTHTHTARSAHSRAPDANSVEWNCAKRGHTKTLLHTLQSHFPFCTEIRNGWEKRNVYLNWSYAAAASWRQLPTPHCSPIIWFHFPCSERAPHTHTHTQYIHYRISMRWRRAQTPWSMSALFLCKQSSTPFDGSVWQKMRTLARVWRLTRKTRAHMCFIHRRHYYYYYCYYSVVHTSGGRGVSRTQAAIVHPAQNKYYAPSIAIFFFFIFICIHEYDDLMTPEHDFRRCIDNIRDWFCLCCFYLQCFSPRAPRNNRIKVNILYIYIGTPFPVLAAQIGNAKCAYKFV